MKVRRTTLKAILIVIIIALLALIGGCVAKSVIEKKNQDNEPIEAPEETIVYGDERLGIDPDVDKMLEGYRNVLIMGLDTEYIENEENNRSDAIVIVSINEENEDVKMFSVYRDTYLKIDDEHGYDKINHAYAFGGIPLSTYAINTNLDLNIRETIALTWETVRTMVDELDGITINILPEEVAPLNGMLDDKNHITSSGEQTINGEQAVQYCRMRYDSSDFRRNERFKDVLAQAFRETQSLPTEERIALAEDMLDLIVSNVPNKTVAETMLEISEYEIKSSTEWPYHKRGWTSNTIYYAVPIDLQKNVSELHYNIFDQEEYIPTDRVLDIKEGIHERTGI